MLSLYLRRGFLAFFLLHTSYVAYSALNYFAGWRITGLRPYSVLAVWLYGFFGGGIYFDAIDILWPRLLLRFDRIVGLLSTSRPDQRSAFHFYRNFDGAARVGKSMRTYKVLRLPTDDFVQYSMCWTDPAQAPFKAFRFQMLRAIASQLDALGLKEIIAYPKIDSNRCLILASEPTSFRDRYQGCLERLFVIDFIRCKLYRLDLGMENDLLEALGNVQSAKLRLCSRISATGELLALQAQTAGFGHPAMMPAHGPNMLSINPNSIMNLPKDLRAMIYDLVLGSGHTVFEGASLTPRYMVESCKSGLALLLVCRSLACEFREFLDRSVFSLRSITVQLDGDRLRSVTNATALRHRQHLSLLVRGSDGQYSETKIIDDAFANIDTLSEHAPDLTQVHAVLAIESMSLADHGPIEHAPSRSERLQARVDGHIATRKSGPRIRFDIVALAPVTCSFPKTKSRDSVSVTWFAVSPLQPGRLIVSAFRAGDKIAPLEIPAKVARGLNENPFVALGLLWTINPPDKCSAVDGRKLESIMPETHWHVMTFKEQSVQ